MVDPEAATNAQSPLGRTYARVYAALCGSHGSIRPWHFQWLALKDLYADLRVEAARLDGRVLDVGCGDKPYEGWAPRTDEWVGIDIVRGPAVDIVVSPDEPWPLSDDSFDAVICTQVLEHAADVSLVIEQIARVLRPGGRFIITAPFVFGEHGAPQDYRRFSRHGLRTLLDGSFEIESIRGEGRIGSVLGVLLLHWIEDSSMSSRATRLAKGPLLPFWIVFSALVNVLGAAIDMLDRTEGYYGNVIVVGTRRPR